MRYNTHQCMLRIADYSARREAHGLMTAANRPSGAAVTAPVVLETFAFRLKQYDPKLSKTGYSFTTDDLKFDRELARRQSTDEMPDQGRTLR